jgi:hypothetical protein
MNLIITIVSVILVLTLFLAFNHILNRFANKKITITVRKKVNMEKLIDKIIEKTKNFLELITKQSVNIKYLNDKRDELTKLIKDYEIEKNLTKDKQ